jgi:hypothetical protein
MAIWVGSTKAIHKCNAIIFCANKTTTLELESIGLIVAQKRQLGV